MPQEGPRVQDYDVFVQETKRQNHRWGSRTSSKAPRIRR